MLSVAGCRLLVRMSKLTWPWSGILVLQVLLALSSPTAHCPHPLHSRDSPNQYQCCPTGTTCVSAGGSSFTERFNCVVANASKVADSVCTCKPGPPLPLDSTRKNVLIIGDSLTIGYTPFLADQLADIALVQHAPWDIGVSPNIHFLYESLRITRLCIYCAWCSQPMVGRRKRRTGCSA